jgi:multidrug efflux pump subunit AcrB
MNLTNFSLRHPRFTFVAFLFVVALGLDALREIPRREDPMHDLPGATVVVIFPGASALEIERLVVRPIEDSIKELDDLNRLRSVVKDGVVVTTVEFKWGIDADKAYDDIQRQVNQARPGLPAGIVDIQIRKLSTLLTATMQLALVSPDASAARLEDVAERLRRRIESVPGVRTTERHALPDRQVRVSLDPDRAAALRVPLAALVGALQAGSTSIPGGAVEIGERRFNIETSGAYRTLDDIRRTPVAGAGASVVRLGDIADVAWATESNEYYARYNGRRAVFLTATAGGGTNLFDVRDRVLAEIARFRTELPADMGIEMVFDQTENVHRRLGQLEKDFVLALALVLVTVFPLGFRASLLVLVSVPLSLALGVFTLNVLGHSLNQISIVGFIIALGLLVDDSIVVVENIARFRRLGYAPMAAAQAATKQITLAVVGTTAALLFAFFPLLNLPGGPGEFIRPLPLAVVATVLASMLVSLTIIPLLAGFLLRADSAGHENRLLRALDRGIHVTYRPLLHFCMQHRLLTLALAGLLTLAVPFIGKQTGFSLFPKAGIPQFLVEIELEEGASLAATDAVVRRVEALVAANPAFGGYAANVGRGNPQVYYNLTGARQMANVGAVLVTVKDFHSRRSPAVIEQLRREVAGISGARVDVIEFQNGPMADAPIAVRLLGDDLTQLTAMAAQVEGVLRRHPGTEGVANPLSGVRTDFKVVVNEEAAAALGVSRFEIDRTVRLAFAGLNVARFRDPAGEEYNLQLALPRGEQATLENWRRIRVATATGAHVPVGQVARLEFISVPPVIEHFNRERAGLVRSQVRNGYNVAQVTAEVGAELARLPWPPGMRWKFAGEVESQEESFNGVGRTLLIAAFGIFAILVLEFGSFRGTLIVASVVPLGLIGGMSALWLTGYTLSFTSSIGFVALVGMEIKNSILLVDFTNQLRAEGVPLKEAIERAGETRFLPIVLTTATALGALVPLALQGSGLYSPLAVVIIGGLLSSLLLSRLVTPVIYSLLPPPVPAAKE